LQQNAAIYHSVPRKSCRFRTVQTLHPEIENFSIGTIFPLDVESWIVIDEIGESGYFSPPKLELSPNHCPIRKQALAHP